MSILSFNKDVEEVLPLTAVDGLDELPALVAPEFGPTHMGGALKFLIEKVDKDVVKNSEGAAGDYKPLLFVITDGKPGDPLYIPMTQKIKECKFGIIVACAAGPKAKTEPLKLLTDKICVLSNMDEESFADFFICVSQSIPIGEWDFPTFDDIPMGNAPKSVHLRGEDEGE